MMYSCTDCKDGTLEAKVRELDLELEEGETAHIIGGRVVITSVGCDNGCTDTVDKPKRKKRETPAEAGDLCQKTDDCTRSAGHTGRCNHKKGWVDAT